MAGSVAEVENNDKNEKERNGTDDKIDAKQKKSEISPECLIKHPLQHTWSLWYLENDRNKTWEENLNEITSFDTVEDFWSLYNHIKLASEVRVGADYSLFKKGIRPMWEDDANKRGGKWVISLERRQRQSELDSLWLDVILLLIGEAFDCAEDICGAVVNIRHKGDKISIWTADGSNKASALEIGRKLKERLRLNPKILIYYQLHKDSMVKSSSIVKAVYTA